MKTRYNPCPHEVYILQQNTKQTKLLYAPICNEEIKKKVKTQRGNGGKNQIRLDEGHWESPSEEI